MRLPSVIPERVYLDTNVIVYALIRDMAHSEVCLNACQALIDADSTIYISHLTRLEFLQAVRGLANSDSLPDEVRQRFALSDWENFMVRERWLNFWADQLDGFLTSFREYYELPYRARAWRDVPRQMAFGPMAAYDAYHLATALSYEVPFLWTTDDGFGRANNGIEIHLLHRLNAG